MKERKVVRAIVYALVFPVSVPMIAYRHKLKGGDLRDLFVRRRRHAPAHAVRWLRSCLWSRRSAEALTRLRELQWRSAPAGIEHAEASQAIAAWLSANGDHAGAAEMLASISLSKLRWPEARAVNCVRAQALQKAGRDDEARAVLETIPRWDSSCRLVLANTEKDPDRKIAILNEVMRLNGQMEIRRADEGAPISVFNLAGRGQARPCPDHGRVSVIFPVYNSERTIAAAVGSILGQTYGNIEIVLVDDSSTDSTWDILSAIAADHDSVKLLRSPANGGAYRARNLGLAHASGDYITTHDADDWSHPEKIERQVLSLHANDTLVANGSHWVRVDPSFRFTSWELRPDLVRRSFPSFMIRREVFDEIGPWDPVRISGDAEFMYRIKMFYGEDRMEWIAPEAPLGFSLSGAASLTNTRATHASSSRHGLRRYYHEAFKYQWRAGDAVSAEARAARLAMCPDGMFRAGAPDRDYDFRLLGDLTRPAVVADIGTLCDSLDGRIAITHVPVVTLEGASHGRFCDAVFDLFRRPGVYPDADTGDIGAACEILVEPLGSR